MKIGVNANFFQKPATGIGVVTLQFMRALAVLPEQAEHEWIWYYEGEVPSGNWPDNWQFRRVETWWRRDDLLHRFCWERFSLPKVVRKDGCKRFLSLYQSTTVLPRSLRHLMLVHDLIPRRFPEYLGTLRKRLYEYGIERAIAEADALAVPSRATKRDLETLLSIDTRRITTIPLGLDPLFLRALNEGQKQSVLSRYGLNHGRYFYHGGGLERRKNTELVLRAYRMLIDHDQGAHPLVISGALHAETNPLATPVRSLIAELGLEEKVKLLGWVPESDLPALYQGACLFLFPSRYEGFGLPVLEAFASGTPVITTRTGALEELVSDAARVIELDDPRQLEEAMASLQNNETERARLSRLGRERAQQYRWSTFTSNLLQALLG